MSLARDTSVFYHLVVVTTNHSGNCLYYFSGLSNFLEQLVGESPSPGTQILIHTGNICSNSFKKYFRSYLYATLIPVYIFILKGVSLYSIGWLWTLDSPCLHLLCTCTYRLIPSCSAWVLLKWNIFRDLAFVFVKFYGII